MAANLALVNRPWTYDPSVPSLDRLLGEGAQLLALLPAVVEVLQVQRSPRFKISWHLGMVTSPTDNGRAPVQTGGVALLRQERTVAPETRTLSGNSGHAANRLNALLASTSLPASRGQGQGSAEPGPARANRSLGRWVSLSDRLSAGGQASS